MFKEEVDMKVQYCPGEKDICQARLESSIETSQNSMKERHDSMRSSSVMIGCNVIESDFLISQKDPHWEQRASSNSTLSIP